MEVIHRPSGTLTEARFISDMSKPKSAHIPLGVFLEVVWPAKGRWFGLVGRDSILQEELEVAKLKDFPELRQPWEFLSKEFNAGWQAAAGKSCEYLALRHRWALNFSGPDDYDVSGIFKDHFDPDIHKMEQLLSAHLVELEKRLLPRDGAGTMAKIIPLRIKSLMPAVRTNTARVELAA